MVQGDTTGEATEWLCKKYPDDLEIDAKTHTGVTPLMLAVKRDNCEAVQALLNARANPFYQDQLGQEATDYAVATTAGEATYPVQEMVELAKTQWLE